MKNLQLFRSSQIYTSLEAAKEALKSLESNSKISGDSFDGTPVIARYTDGEETKTLLGLIHATENKRTVTIIENAADLVLDGEHINIYKSDTKYTVPYKYVNDFGAESFDETDTIAAGFEKVQASLDALAGVVIDNEEVTEKAIETLATSAGLVDNDGVISYVPNTEANYISNAESLADADNKLDAAINSLSASNLSVDDVTIVKDTENKISTNIEIIYVPAVQESETAEAKPAHIALKAIDGEELSNVAISDIIGSGILSASSYDAETGELKLYFVGQTEPTIINLKAMLDINDVVIGTGSTNYLSATLSEGEESGITLNALMKDISAATATETGLADAYQVKTYVDGNKLSAATVNGVDAAISENALSVTINGDNIEVASAYTSTSYPTELSGASAVAASDKISSAFKKVETTVSALTTEVLNNEKVAEEAVEALANAAGTVDENGNIVYVSATTANYISGATSLADADVKLDAAIKDVADKVNSAITSVTSSEDCLSASTTNNAVTLKFNHTLAEEGAGFTHVTEDDTTKFDISFNFGTW